MDTSWEVTLRVIYTREKAYHSISDNSMVSWLGFSLRITRVTNKVIELLIEVEALFYLKSKGDILL